MLCGCSLSLFGGSSWKRTSGGLKEWSSAWDLLNVCDSVLGVVFPKDGKRRKDRSRAFRVAVFNHNPTCNTFSVRSNESPLHSHTKNFCRVEQLKHLWSADKFVARESPIGIL